MDIFGGGSLQNWTIFGGHFYIHCILGSFIRSRVAIFFGVKF